MRFYTKEESIELSNIFNDNYFADEYYTQIQLSSSITNEDFLSQNVMKFSEFKKKFVLNVNDAYEELSTHLDISEEGNGVPYSTEFNKNMEGTDLRYPIIILCNNVDTDNVPDMIHYTELFYTLEHFDDEDLEVLVIDKMIRPFDKDLLDRFADYFSIDDYDYENYK